MRLCAILLLILSPLGTAEAGRQSVKSIAKKAGLDGKPGEDETKGGETWRHWRNPSGHRWQFVARDAQGHIVKRADGIQLVSGRYSLRSREGKVLTLASEWTANGVRFEQHAVRATDGYESHRTSGNGILRRVTGTGIAADGPLRFTTDKQQLVPVVLEQVPTVAAQRGRSIEVELNDHLLPAHVGDDIEAVRARGRKLGVIGL